MSGHEETPIDVAREIDRLCLQFERAWQSSERPRIEQFLSQWDGPVEFLPQLFGELLRVELDLLADEKVFPSLHQYAVRFPEDFETVDHAFAQWYTDVDRDLTATHIAQQTGFDAAQPSKVGRYLIKRELGRGAFGVVYLAEDPKLNCLVAIKQLSSEWVTEALGGDPARWPKVSDGLMREARLAAQLRQYQGVVTVLDVLTTSKDDSPGDIFFVQEYLDGGPLKDLMRPGPISPTETARILEVVAQTMGHVHEHGIYHRDLKPGNIILDGRGNPCVVDFGLAVDAEIQQELQGEVSGTYPYMAPEQLRGEVHLLDGRADVWALGVILYEMLTGVRPFRSERASDLSVEICRRDPPPLRSINAKLPVEFERICQRCLSKRMTDRYATAGELSEDLRRWLDEYRSGSTPPSLLQTQEARFVPRGLRSFDERDADVFPELLPGPRTREGLPESIGFWKQRIEEKDPGKTFRVGLLYGPSGCGKSSLVRAGLIPRLKRVLPVYVESTSVDTEARILVGLRKVAPKLSKDLSLPEAIMALREHPALSGFEKVLLVIDQFEQWLQSRTTFGREQLVEAVRQCDGARVQALLLVRDDFWMAITRFLHELEVDAIPGENLSAVDLLPLDHARTVLTRIGRAYGRLEDTDEPTKDQQEFLETVVAGVSDEGNVNCVRLTMFAEMVKTREWVPDTIEQVGGTDGVGERFLDEAFSSSAANPAHRAHEQAARQVLQALLPDVGTLIRGHMRSHAELLDVSGYDHSPDRFAELLRILNSELRLITPTDPTGIETASGRESPATHYQLTHDYLVPSLRRWLTRRQRSTRRGRAQLLLSELTESWHVRPDPRRLPSSPEWLSIVWWTRRSDRTEQEQQVVRAKTKRMARSSLFWIVGLILLGWLGYETNGRFQAGAVVQSIGSADPQELPLFTANLNRYRPWALPRLEQEIVQAQDDGESRRERQLELALAVLDSSRASAVFDELNSVPVEDLSVFAYLLKPHAPQLADELWERFDNARLQADSSALKPAALLASFAPHDERWQEHAAFIAEQLFSGRTSDAAHWRQLLQPVGSHLAPELVDRTADRSNLAATQQATLLDLIMAYASDSPELLAQAVEFAAPEELPELLQALEQHTDAGICVQERLTELTADERTDRTGDVPREVRAAVEEAGGLASAEGAFVQSVSRQSFDELDGVLQEAGYAATSVRPYQSGDDLFVAAVWGRDTEPGEIRWDLSIDEVASIDQEMREGGMVPVDFGRYRNDDDSDASETRWVIVWRKVPGEAPDTKLITSVTLEEFLQQSSELPEEGYSIDRFDVWLATNQEPRCSLIWTQGDEIDFETFADWRYARAFGDLSPGTLQTDIRFDCIAPTSRDRIGVFKHLNIARDGAESSTSIGMRDSKRLATSRYYAVMGDIESAKRVLDKLDSKWSQNAIYQKYRGLLYARSGESDRLRELIAEYADNPSANVALTAYLRFRAAAASGETDRIEKLLEELENVRPLNSNVKELLARSHAVLASVSSDTSRRSNHADKSVSLLRELLSGDSIEVPESLIFDVDFDSLRETSDFEELFHDSGFRQRYAVSYSMTEDVESHVLYGLDPTSHLNQSAVLVHDGFHPHVVSITREPSGPPLCCSVWHRSVITSAERVDRARREANLLLAAARIGDTERLSHALFDHGRANLRSYLVVNAARALSPNFVMAMLDDIEADNNAATQALGLILGDVPAEFINSEDQQILVGRLRRLTDSRDAGVRSAARWSLRRLGARESTLGSDEPVTEDRNPVGQRLLLVTPPERHLMGSPGWESGREEQETRGWITIPRDYALADTETTNAAFYRFLQDERVRDHYGRQISRFHLNSSSVDDERPVVGVTWRDAALFCQWLSEMDPEIPEDQYCFPEIWDSDSRTLPDNYLERTGYRLPTEAEWEWAARGTIQSASRFCGDDDQTLRGYAWFLENSRTTRKPVGRLRPNGLGFFDMLGNAIEWCDDQHDGYRRPLDGIVRSDAPGNEHMPPDSEYCVLRGGNHRQHHAEELRSANRWFNHPTYRSSSTGFRVARTIRAH